MRRSFSFIASVAALVVALTLAIPVGGIPMAHASTANTTVVVPDGTYPPGDYKTKQQSIAAGEVTDINAQLTLIQPVAGTNFSYKIWVSHDGGQTWDDPATAFCAGGPSSKTGQLVNWGGYFDTQFTGPAIWYAEVSFAKSVTVQGVSVTVTTTP